MIFKKHTKSLHYIDRDTDVPKLVEEIIRVKRSELTIFLQRQYERLQEKEAGEYFTVEDTTKLKDGELEKMMRFFRGAVVPYYVRQSQDIWSDGLDPDIVLQCTDEIKRAVGFIRYNHDGHPSEQVNSLTTFERVKDFAEFLKMVEVVCFDDEEYIYPDSDYFLKLEKEKGRDAAQRQVIHELHEKVKNKFYKREITP